MILVTKLTQGALINSERTWLGRYHRFAIWLRENGETSFVLGTSLVRTPMRFLRLVLQTLCSPIASPLLQLVHQLLHPLKAGICHPSSPSKCPENSRSSKAVRLSDHSPTEATPAPHNFHACARMPQHTGYIQLRCLHEIQRIPRMVSLAYMKNSRGAIATSERARL